MQKHYSQNASAEQVASRAHQFGHPDGRPVIFLHGANQTGAMWRDVASFLPDHHAVCFDLPGSGRNKDHPFGSIDTAADLLAAAIRAQFPGERVPIAALSLGAYIGLRLALKHPDIVASATLSGFQIAPLKGRMMLILVVAVLSPFLTGYGFRKRTARLLGIPERSAAWPLRDAPCGARTLREINRAAVAFDAREALRGLEVPVLALAGEYEAAPVQDALDQIRQCSRFAEAATVPGVHACPASRPDLFARILLGWSEDQALVSDPDVRRLEGERSLA